MKLSYHTAWLLVLLLIGGFIYMISPILLPFLIGMGLAYMLDPLADILEDHGSSRIMATLLISIVFFLICTVILLAGVPMLIDQIGVLLNDLPDYYRALREVVEPYYERLALTVDMGDSKAQKDLISTISDNINVVLVGILKSGMALVNFLSLMLITPLVAFYLLRDWDVMVGKVKNLLPRRYAATICEQCRAIDDTLAAFLRGQLNVMMVLALFYAVALTFAGLKYSIIVALVAGLLIIIPYIGTVISGALAVAIAYFQFGDMQQVAIIAAIFISGQILEGYFLTPKLVGESVGLNPIWIIFGMLAGGTIMGFAGILLAVPLTAICGVLIRFAVEQYIESDLYMMEDDEAQDTAPKDEEKSPPPLVM